MLVGGHSSGGVQYAQRVDGCQREQFVAATTRRRGLRVRAAGARVVRVVLSGSVWAGERSPPCEVAWWVMKWQLAVELYRVGEAEEEDGAVGSD